MSKRGTENQITKDDYERGDDDESTPQLGAFRMASTEELSKRTIKPLRRSAARKGPSPFASIGITPSNSTSSQVSATTSSSSVTTSANPFAAFTFGAPPVTTGVATTKPISETGGFTPTTAAPTVTAAPMTSQPNTGNVFAGFAGLTPKTTGDNMTTTPGNSFANGTFTFNIGSSAKLEPTPSENQSYGANTASFDREGYHNALRAVNQTFLKKIQKGLEDNPILNLAQVFNKYIVHRAKARSKYLGVEEPRTIILSPGGNAKFRRAESSESASSSPPGIGSSKIIRVGSESEEVPQTGFGLPIDITAKSSSMVTDASKDEGSPTRTPPGTSGISSTLSTSVAAKSLPSASTSFPSFGAGALSGAGSSSMKGAVDPPKNPIASGSGWNFGGPFGSPGAAAPNLFGTGTIGPIKSLKSASSPSGFGSGSISVTGAKPFEFTPKPFSFSVPSTMSASSDAPTAAPKPFSFTVPTSTPAASSSTSDDQANEKMPDDTKSNLVDTREGEEGEITVFEVRAKLYSIVDGNLKDMGVGQFKVNENQESKRRRMIMRIGGTGSLVLNSWVYTDLPPKRDEQKTTLTVFSVEDGKPKMFRVKVKEEQSRDDLFKALEAGLNNN
ncbi:hypothetical protein BX616_003095 [Lobosporangium transversale]|nr:hypothetical protein BX616_003095 [Lobosporangium transversale]